VKAGSLQIRPGFSRFPFNPPQVMGQTKLNRRKRKPRNNPQAIFFNYRILALNGSPKSPFLTSTCRIFKKRKTIYATFFFLNTEDATCLLGKGQSKMSQTEADLPAPCMFFNMAHSSY